MRKPSSCSEGKIIEKQVKMMNEKHSDMNLSSSLEENINIFKTLFTDDDTIVTRHIQNSHDPDLDFFIFYCDGLVNSIVINENIIKPLILTKSLKKDELIIDTLLHQVLLVNEIEKTNSIQKIIESVTYGDTILMTEGSAEALILNTKSFELRAISEPNTEKALSGPREGFCEALLINLSLIRRKLRTNELKMKFYNIGRKTHTQLGICYIESIVNKKILAELYKRLDKIDIDGILDANYITELVRDSALSPFRTTGYTERPDVVVGKLLEGRIAIFVDGTPVVLTIPYLFIENFQSNEDYYLNYYYTSFSRMLRILAFFLTITVPAFYIAILAFHREMLPTPLLINIAQERHIVPLPATLEAFTMLLVFEILRETGIRMPSNVGQALSIVGALVIGQAAVEAKLVASAMIIVVATTAITSLLVPKLNSPILFIRIFLLAISSMFGIFGFMLGLGILMTHILNLHSFGISQITPTGKLQYQEVKDIFIRAPWWQMRERPRLITKNNTRMK